MNLLSCNLLNCKASGIISYTPLYDVASLYDEETYVYLTKSGYISSISLNNLEKTIRSSDFIRKVIYILKLKDESGNVMSNRKFLRNLEIKHIRKDNSLNISYAHKNGESAIQIVNTVISTLINYDLSATIKDLEYSIAYLELNDSIQKKKLENKELFKQYAYLFDDEKDKNKILNYHKIRIRVINEHMRNKQSKNKANSPHLKTSKLADFSCFAF